MSNEQEPSLPLQWGDRTLEMTPYNATLYTFLGRTVIERDNEEFEIDNSSVNHIFLVTDEGNKGLYFFATEGGPFTQMATFMVEHSFPMLVNSREVPNGDLQVWTKVVDKAAEKFADEIPDFLSDK